MAVNPKEAGPSDEPIQTLRTIELVGSDGETKTLHSIRKFTELISPEDDPYREEYIRQCARGDNGKDLSEYTYKLEYVLYIQDEARTFFERKEKSEAESDQPQLNLG